MTVTERYTYLVTWSPEDEQHIGLCEELGGLSVLADSQVGALTGIVGLVAGVVKDLEANGEPVPDPASDVDGYYVRGLLVSGLK